MVDTVSLLVALGAVVISVFIYFETRRQRKLTEVMVESLAFLHKRSKPHHTPRASKGMPPATAPSNAGAIQAQTPTTPAYALGPLFVNKVPSAPEQARISLAQQREERRRLELQLRQQREQWKRQKDVAKAIGWVLDRIGRDEDYEDDE
jgi:hypothetical protein